MKGRDLMRLLIGDVPVNAIAEAARGSQPQLHRYLKGESTEPRSSTLEPFARYFGVPLEAFRNPDLARKIAAERGLLPGAEADGLVAIAAPAPAESEWPFPGIDERKVRELSWQQRKTLAGRLLIEAAELGIDIQKQRAASTISAQIYSLDWFREHRPKA